MTTTTTHKTLNLRVPAAEHALMKAIAARDCMSVTACIRRYFMETARELGMVPQSGPVHLQPAKPAPTRVAPKSVRYPDAIDLDALGIAAHGHAQNGETVQQIAESYGLGMGMIQRALDKYSRMVSEGTLPPTQTNARTPADVRAQLESLFDDFGDASPPTIDADNEDDGYGNPPPDEDE